MKTVLYHADADGFGAAFAFWKKYGTKGIEYIPVQYGTPVPDIHEKTTEVYVVDFSYDRRTCLQMAERFDKVVVLDHHKTAQEDLKGLPFAVFDQDKSGCHLAWEYVFPTSAIPSILRYVEDRDLWRFDLDMSEEVNLAISATPLEFEAWEEFSVNDAKRVGSAIKSFRDNQIDPHVRNGKVTEFLGVPAVVVNCSANISETGHQLLSAFPDAKMAVMYMDRSSGVRSYSLRSRGDFDVSVVASSQGGGGHAAAAGFAHAEPPAIEPEAVGEK